MFESIAQETYGKVDSAGVLEFGQVVLIDELLLDIPEFDLHVL